MYPIHPVCFWILKIVDNEIHDLHPIQPSEVDQSCSVVFLRAFWVLEMQHMFTRYLCGLLVWNGLERQKKKKANGSNFLPLKAFWGQASGGATSGSLPVQGSCFEPDVQVYNLWINRLHLYYYHCNLPCGTSRGLSSIFCSYFIGSFLLQITNFSLAKSIVNSLGFLGVGFLMCVLRLWSGLGWPFITCPYFSK